ncbi:SIR2 family NAD-dependent protein deacylase [Comamonas sp. NoAH]|uniref:SIR2 family NAD-dependent protein deacylase n=1 Tax=Comamonas halotolerans TaxID=3041496 RepID=UPI0024E0C618|nr:NAD-dependent deacylase [Comamonas sp. NoAH]
MSALTPDRSGILDRVRQWVQAAQQVVVFSGAGVSAESGVPTFRDTHTGYWAQFDPQEMASEQGFRAHPQRVWQWYAYRRVLVAQVQPNAAHHALVTYAQANPGKLSLITQNVDGLHQRAGSLDAIGLHGDLMRNQWLNACCPHCDTDAALAAGGEPPQCVACNNMLRPGVVWFGEHLPEQALEQAEAAANACDVMLVVGTSGVVYPAAGLVFQAHQSGAKIVVINPEATELDMLADALLRGPAAQLVPAVLAAA